MRIIGIIITILFLYIPPIFALDIDLTQEVMGKNITKSFQEEPDNWLIKSHYLIYASDLKQIQKLRKRSFPESDDFAELVIIYSIYNNYVNVEKPFELDFHGKIEKILLLEIKKFIYKDLKKQVGYLVDKEENIKNKVKEIPVEVKEEVGGMKKL